MINVRPLDDAVEHELSEQCVCGPDVVRTQGHSGEVAHFVYHFPLLPAVQWNPLELNT